MIYKRITTLCAALQLFAALSYAQVADSNTVKNILRAHINALAAPYMYGRGYIDNGLGLGAEYVVEQFTRLNLKHMPGMQGFRQQYFLPVNTFPGKVELVLNDVKLSAGKDFLVDAASPAYKGSRKPVKYKDIGGAGSVEEWKKTIATFNTKNIWVLQHADSFCKTSGVPFTSLHRILPEGCFIIPVKTKQSWTVAVEQADATVFYVYDSVLPTNITVADIEVTAKMKNKFPCNNIVAKIDGENEDSFLVFSAHYDHLGKMGPAVFPGASDNASGMAMLLYLAEYFSTHKPKYTMVFIAFSGEEAGLRGSAHFVNDPPFRFKKIKFLTNIDIMGDATAGVTVVNATEFPERFTQLTAINDAHKYLPEIKSRGKAANSDHYHFTEKGVPAFFIYSMGGKGFYHDIYDRPEEVTLNNTAGVAQLLIDFVTSL